MSVKQLNQLSFAHLANKQNASQATQKMIQWRPIERILAQYYYTKGQSKIGRSAYQPMLLFKACLLQTWYDLSDYQLEDQMKDRCPFKRFCQLSAFQSLPDHSVISRFRKALSDTPAYEKLLREFNKQLAQQGHMVQEGVIVDASITPTPRKPKGKKTYYLSESDPSAPLQEVPKKGVDQQASWVKRGNKLHYGYKRHYLIDQQSGLVLGVHTTGAHAHKSKYLGCLLDKVSLKAGSKVLADKGYRFKENKAAIKSLVLKPRLQYKRTGGECLSVWHSKYDKQIGLGRYKVEHVFGSIKSWFKTSQARYVGQANMHLQHVLEGLAYNLYRAPGLVLYG